ncbi:ALG1 family protein [Megaselia abdita]
MSSTPSNNRQRACIVVAGDIGRSPRMQYHATSLVNDNYNVDIIGYMESKPMDVLLTDRQHYRIHELSEVPVTNFPPKLKYAFKAIWQSLSLVIALLSIQRPQFLLVQNPPAVPTLFICYLYCKLMRTKFVIDWHNYSYSILALSANENSLIVRLAKWIEKKFGAKADSHLCVTNAMKEDLETNWGIESAVVLYDRPPLQFKPIDLNAKHDLFVKLSVEYPEFLSEDSDDDEFVESTVFTRKLSNGTVQWKENRPGLLVSSTSWTADEDFGILLKALEEYENAANQENSAYPDLICVITGKGPQKDEYIQKIAAFDWNKVTVVTPWLLIEDYPKVLASADLGVCLHWSSSGLDLPMKVVDMFGCGLPVCAINFKCLDELVVHEKNGFIFENYKELADQLKFWFAHFNNNIAVEQTKEKFQRRINEFQSLRWKENWQKNALPVFKSLS